MGRSELAADFGEGRRRSLEATGRRTEFDLGAPTRKDARKPLVLWAGVEVSMTDFPKAEAKTTAGDLTREGDVPYDGCPDSENLAGLVRGCSLSAPAEGLALMRAFLNIQNARTRKSLVNLLLALSRNSSDGPRLLP